MVNGAEKAAPVLPLSDALVRFPGHQFANELDDLDHDPDKHHAHPDHVGVAALVAIDDGHLAQAGAAQGGGHGGVAQNGDSGDDRAVDQRGLGLGQQHMPHDLPVGAAHGLGGLDDPAGDLLHRGLHHPGDVGGGGNN